MQTLGSSAGKPNWLEKLFRIAIPAALIWGGIKLFNAVAPSLLEFFDNLWKVALVGVPTAFILLWIISNPTLIWMSYKTLCRKLSSFIIKMDPLSFMDRYVDLLKKNRQELQKTKQSLNADKIELEREIKALKENVDKNMKMAKAALGIGQKDEASHHSNMASTDKKSMELYLPIYKKLESNLEFLSKLDENWGRSIESLSHTVKQKRREYEMLAKMAKALGKASEFAKGDTEASRIYAESVLALEQNVSAKISFIEEFMSNSKGAMKSMDLEKQMMNEEGLSMLDEYMKNGSAFLDEDFQKFEINVNDNQDLFSKPKASPTLNTSYNDHGVSEKKNEFDFLKK